VLNIYLNSGRETKTLLIQIFKLSKLEQAESFKNPQDSEGHPQMIFQRSLSVVGFPVPFAILFLKEPFQSLLNFSIFSSEA